MREEPYSTVEQTGRWTYRVAVHDGIARYGPDGYWWTVVGRRRAMRKAEQVLARYKRRQGWESDIVKVHSDG